MRSDSIKALGTAAGHGAGPAFSPRARLLHRTPVRRAAKGGVLLPPGFGIVVFLLAIGFVWGPNLGLLALSLAVLVAGTALTWRPGEPAVIFFVFGMQWLEASIAIFAAQLEGVPIDDMAQLSNADMAGATALTLIGLLVLMAAIRWTAGPVMPGIVATAREQALRLPVQRMLTLYLLAIAVGIAAKTLAGFIPGLNQPLLALAQLKWAAFIILTFAAFVRGGAMRQLFFIAFALEFLMSLGGFFSSFKFVFIYTFIGLLAANVRFTTARIVGVGGLMVLAILAGIAWSAVKEDYRYYVNAGSGTQTVTVGWAESVDHLVGLTVSMDAATFADGADLLVKRLTYVEFFGAAMNWVPTYQPHTWGTLWIDAITRPFMPRILFPGKAIVDESALTNRYTGLSVSGIDQGTQISIGYYGESYIDFGMIGMMFALAALGAVLGFAYRSILTAASIRGVIAFGFATVLLVGPLQTVGMSAVKLLGGFIILWLVLEIVKRTVSAHTLLQLRKNRPSGWHREQR